MEANPPEDSIIPCWLTGLGGGVVEHLRRDFGVMAIQHIEVAMTQLPGDQNVRETDLAGTSPEGMPEVVGDHPGDTTAPASTEELGADGSLRPWFAAAVAENLALWEVLGRLVKDLKRIGRETNEALASLAAKQGRTRIPEDPIGLKGREFPGAAADLPQHRDKIAELWTDERL